MMPTTKLSSSLRLAGAIATAAALITLMAACASPEPTLHTLAARPAAMDTVRFERAFRLAGVRVPDRLDKPQIVLRTSDSEVQALEQQRWAAPFGAELRDALSANLSTALAAVDVGGGAAPAHVPLYRITADMRSYDARPGQRVTALLMWRITRDGREVPAQATPASTPATLTCQTALTEPVGNDVNAVVTATQRVVQQWSEQIAQSALGLESAQAMPAWCR